MAAPILHSDQRGLNILVGENIKLAGQLGLLTDQNVIDATSYTDLKNFIDTNALGLHADQQAYAERLRRAIDIGYADGTLTDANVQAATGYANLASLTLSDPSKIGGPLLE